MPVYDSGPLCIIWHGRRRKTLEGFHSKNVNVSWTGKFQDGDHRRAFAFSVLKLRLLKQNSIFTAVAEQNTYLCFSSNNLIMPSLWSYRLTDLHFGGNVHRLRFIHSSYWQVKAVPLQVWSGPEGSRKLRFPDFMTAAQEGGKVVSLRHRPHLHPGNSTGTPLC